MVASTLAHMREWAQDPQAVVWIIKGRAILPEDVTNRPDDRQLIEFIRDKLSHQER